VDDARDLLARDGIDAAAITPMVDSKFMSAFVRPRKPRPACGRKDRPGRARRLAAEAVGTALLPRAWLTERAG
jgi:hypothetical protein